MLSSTHIMRHNLRAKLWVFVVATLRTRVKTTALHDGHMTLQLFGPTCTAPSQPTIKHIKGNDNGLTNNNTPVATKALSTELLQPLFS